jgi:RNA polymerase sigma factor (sigma-70 family)
MAIAQRELEARRPVQTRRKRDCARVRPGDPDADLTEVVAAAADGNSWAWTVLSLRFGGKIVAIARSCRLNDADVAEVHQATWLRLFDNIGRIEQPDRIGGWLATTAKRESLKIAQSKARLAFDHEGLMDRPDMHATALDDGLLIEEQVEAVRRAFELLPPHCRRLLDVLAGDDSPSYQEIATALSMPIGSIGPTRGRCLDHLRRIMEELGTEV